MPAAPPTNRQFITTVSMMIASAIVAIEKKMPRIRRVSRPTPRPSSRPTHRGGRDLHHQRRARRLEQGHRRVDADAEKGVGAEIDVAGIAAEDAPGDRERDELQDHVAGKERILVADDLRHRQHGDEEDGHAGPESDAVAVLHHRPSRPCGRTASTPSSIANEIAGAQEAPNIVSTMDSATPRMMAAISVPLMLPSPAMTTTQKVRPI